MKLSRLLIALEDHLAPRAEEMSAVVSVAADPDSALEQLAGNAPSRWRIVLVWTGYTGIESDDNDLWQDSGVSVFIQVPESMAKAPNNELHRRGPGGSAPMLDRIQDVITWLRAVRIAGGDDTDQRGLRLQGSGWESETSSGLRVQRTHRLDFLLVTALDTVAGHVALAL